MKSEILVDEEPKKESKLLELIKQVNLAPEPTMEDYLQEAPTNLWRNINVQKQQLPLSQIDDKYTIAGLQLQQQKDFEKFRTAKQNQQSRWQETFFEKLEKWIPSASTVGLLSSAKSQDLDKLAYHLRKMRTDNLQTKTTSEMNEEIRRLKQQIAALESKTTAKNIPTKSSTRKKAVKKKTKNVKN